MNFRMATLADLDTLAAARWAFRAESTSEAPIESQSEFARRYAAFVRDALDSGRVVYWLADEAGGELVAHMAVCIVPVIPRPSRVRDQWGYLTDCYTQPAFRNRGIGRELLGHVVAWAQDRDRELLLVWPSDESVSFYARAGFEVDDELRVLRLRDYDAPSDAGELPPGEQSNEH